MKPRKAFISRYGHSFFISLPCCSSHVVVGPHWVGVIATTLVILGGAWMNLRLIAKTDNLDEASQDNLCYFVYIFAVLTMWLHFKTAFTDPGIIFSTDPRRGVLTCDEESCSLARDLHFCSICKIAVPESMMSGHCFTCGYCIEGMDHHCPWMGQCIGKRNKR